MKQLLIVFFTSLFANYASSQVFTFSDSFFNQFENGDDPWNGDLCVYIGDPSSGIIDFRIRGFNAVSVTMSTSNLLVVPVNNSNLDFTLNFNVFGRITGGTAFINPISQGQSTILVTAFNPNWETENFILDVTAKTCRDIQIVRQFNINPLNLLTTNTFSANIMTQTTGAVTIPTGSDIEFIAGNNVVLNPNFEVEPGAEFLADIGPCVVQ